MKELAYADLGNIPLRRCRNCRGVLLNKSTYDVFRPDTTAEKIRDEAADSLIDEAVDQLFDLGSEGLPYIVELLARISLD